MTRPLAARHYLLVALGVALAIPVGSARAPVPKHLMPKESLHYFPTTPGAKWVYSKSFPGARADNEVVDVVTAVEVRKDGSKVVTVGRLQSDGKPLLLRKFEVSRRGLYVEELGALRELKQVMFEREGVPYPGPWWGLKLPRERGQTWEGGGGTLTAYGPERVRVPAGVYEAIRVEYHPEVAGLVTTTDWYAPGVGLVKRTEGKDARVIFVLKTFTLPTD